MEDLELERRINSTRKLIDDSDLSEDHKESLHESVEQAARCANGSTEKLHDLTVAFCKSVLRSARNDVSFGKRVADAMKDPLAAQKEEIVEALREVVQEHIVDCPMRKQLESGRFGGQRRENKMTWMEFALALAGKKYLCFAFAVTVFSPNLPGIIQGLSNVWQRFHP